MWPLSADVSINLLSHLQKPHVEVQNPAAVFVPVTELSPCHLIMQMNRNSTEISYSKPLSVGATLERLYTFFFTYFEVPDLEKPRL